MIEIRPGALADAPTIAAFQVAMARETEGMKLDPEVVGRGVRAVFEDPTKGKYWVAADGDEVVGCLLTLPEWSDWRAGTVLWIHSVYVAEAARGRGVYRLLYENLQALVRADPGLRGLRLYVDHRNPKAAAVYEKLGMDGEHYQLYEWMPEG